MANFLKQTIFVFLLLSAGFYAFARLPLKDWASEGIINYFARYGVHISKLEVDTLSPIGAEVSHIEMAPSRTTIGIMRLNVMKNNYDVENLRIPGFINGQDGVFNVKARMGVLEEKMGFICDVTGQPQDMAAHFLLFPARNRNEGPQIHVINASMRWQPGGLLSVLDTTFPLSPVSPVLFSLHLSDLPLDTVIKMAAGPQAQATGTISGVIPLEYSYGQLRVLGLDLGTKQPGLFRLVSGPVPGATPEQAAMLNMLSNFQYSSLQIAAMGNPPTLVLTITGRNPAIASAQETKLQFNLGPAGLGAVNRALGASQSPLPVQKAR